MGLGISAGVGLSAVLLVNADALRSYGKSSVMEGLECVGGD